MAESVSIQCGFCHKRFHVPANLHDHRARCPHCKTVVKITPTSEAGREAVAAISDLVAKEKAEHDKRPLTQRHQVVLSRGGIRNQSVAIVWVALLVIALIVAGVVGVILYNRSSDNPQAQGTNGPGAGSFDGRAPSEDARKAWGGAATGQGAAKTDPSAAKTETPAGKAEGPPPPVADPIAIKIERLIGGFRDDTVSYAVGRVTNNSGSLVKVLKIIVNMLDKDGKSMGEGVDVILNLPAGKTAPLVAEWQHDEGLRAAQWFPSYRLNPEGITQDMPALVVSDPLALRDPNAMAMTGRVSARVTNLGVLPVPQVLVSALLLDASGKIVGVVKGPVDKTLPPKKPTEVMIPWDKCASHLVHSVEVWIQPSL